MSQQTQKVDLVPRFLAALIDGLIGSIPLVIPIIGAIIGTAYMLTKDAIMYEITKDEQWRNKSIGKKLLRIEVRPEQSDQVDWATSIKRNIPLSLGTIIGIVPLIGLILGPIISILLAIIEIVLMLSSPEGKRLGDRIANTMVIREKSANASGNL